MLPPEIAFGARLFQPQPSAVLKPPTADSLDGNAMNFVKDVSTPEKDFPVGRKRSASEVLQDDDDILNPTVMCPYTTKVGEEPRKVQIERRKRLYALQSIIELLDQEGLITDDVQLCDGNLPLHLFDNTDYETRKPSQWVDKIKKVCAEAAFVDCKKQCVWKDCEVLDYAEDGHTYLVRWNDTGQTSWIPRILLHFKAESPFVFVKRFAEAYKEREQAELLMKYNHYVNSMPKEDIPPVGPEQEEHIRELSFTVKEYRERQVDFSKYMKEVNSEYARVMNQITFYDNLRNQKLCIREFTVELDMEFIGKVPSPAPL